MRSVIFCIFFLAGSHFQNSRAQTAVTPVSYHTKGFVYTQNFDGLPNSGSFLLTGKGPVNLSGSPVNGQNLPGWQLLMTAGSNTNAVFAVSTGSSTGNGMYSLGSSGSTDRALGSLSSSTGIYAIGLVLTNNTGLPLNAFTVSFTTEQWRKGGSTNKNTWAFRYKTGVFTDIDQTGLIDEHNLDMHSVITTSGGGNLNGNLTENRQSIVLTIDSVNWKNGEQLLLRWDDADEPGSDDICGIDNFNFSALLVSDAPTAVTTAANFITSDSAVLNGFVNDNFSNTVIVFEYDTTNTFSNISTVNAFPGSILSGAGNTHVSAMIKGLNPGYTYFFRVKAINLIGSRNGAILNFTTPLHLPAVTTHVAGSVSANTADLGGNISATGGSAITERGIVWSVNNNPTLLDNKISMGNGIGNFTQTVTGLPEGSAIYARAYGTSVAGTAYGNNESFTTQTVVLSLTTASASLTNTASVNFIFKTAQAITGLTASNFLLITGGISGAAITAINGSGNTYTITIHTGNGDGIVGLKLANDIGLSPSINNKPFTATGFYTIDKTPPIIRSISIPDRSMKTGDTIPVTVLINPDTDHYKMVTGNINGFTLSGFGKKNDSTYTCLFIIPNSGTDVAAAANIPVTLLLTDSIGNSSAVFQSPISQSSDPLDANKPFITGLIVPAIGVYKAGDTLTFIFRFNEKIILTATGGTAGFSLTVGTKARSVVYSGGSGSDSVLFRYIIQSGDSDKDGIKTGSPVTLNNTSINDLAGNNASIVFNNPPSTKNIIIDGIPPVVSSVTVPAAAIYKTGNVLDFMVNYSKKVIVNTSEGSPSLTISIGTKLKNAMYISGTGSTALLFRYTIQGDDMDKDGIKLLLSINVNMATIKDDAGNQASLVLNNIGTVSNISINPVTVAISNVVIPSPGIYRSGDTLEYFVRFTEKVFVTNGLPSVKLTIGNTPRHAFYQNGSGSNTLAFIHEIQPGDEDTNGVKINTGISLNNSFIKDEQGNNVPVSLTNIVNASGTLVDAVFPSIKHVIVPAKNMYKESDTLDFIVHFTEKVSINIHTDTPFIKLLAGNTSKKIAYINGSGTDGVLFRYSIQKGDIDKNGIKLDTLITAGQNSIIDLAGNPAIRKLKNIGAISNVKIDAVAPSFALPNAVNLVVCENAAAFPINESLTVIDEEAGELLTWQVLSGVTHGTLSKLISSSSSTGNSITPGNILYKPNSHYSGQDTIVFQVSDGVNMDQKRVIINIQPALKNNSIGPSQIICTNNIPAPIAGSTPSGGDGVYRLTWEFSASADSTGFNKAVGTNNLQHYAPAQLTTNTWFRRKVVSGECMDISGSSQITVLQNGLWTGAINSDWHNSNNWCNGAVPDNAMDIFIYGNALHNPVIKDTAWCNHLTLFNNAALAVNGILQVKGNISTTTGAIDARKGTIVFNGTTPQTIPAGLLVDRYLKNLVVNNSTGISLPGPLSITSTLLLNSGSLITNNYLTLKHTANIGPSATGTFITGDVSIEHYIKGGRRVFRLLGHPFTNPIGLEMIKDSMDITGGGGSVNGFTNTATNQPSAFRYDISTGNDSLGIDAGWMEFTNTNGQAENSWKEFSGIRLLVRGRPGQGLDGTPAGDGNNGTYLPLPVILALSGNIHTGDKEVLLTKGKHGTYHVIANPYPCTIDLSLVTRGNDVAPNYWVWNPLQAHTGGYSSVPFKSRNMLPPFGAFIVKATGNTNNTLLFTENCKINTIAADSLATINDDGSYFIELRLLSDSIFWDRLILLAIDSAKSSIDKNDAEKFRNSDLNFYSISREQRMLSIDARPVNNESTILLGLQANTPGTFSIRVAKLSLPSSNSLMLHDKYLDKWMKLEKDSSYHFSTTADTGSMGNRRFEITTPKKLVPTPAFKIITRVSPVPATDKIIVNYFSPEKGNTRMRMLNLSGIPVKNIALGIQKEGQITVSVADMIPGIYLLEVQCGELTSTQKIIKK